MEARRQKQDAEKPLIDDIRLLGRSGRWPQGHR